jgi:hypothetical protein
MEALETVSRSSLLFFRHLEAMGDRKSEEDGTKATRNYIENYIRIMFEIQLLDKNYTDLIEKKLNELRLIKS